MNSRFRLTIFNLKIIVLKMPYLFLIIFSLYFEVFFAKKTSIYYLFSPRYGGPRKVYQKWQTSYPRRLHQMVPLHQSSLVQNDMVPYCCSLRYLRIVHRNNWWSGKTNRCKTFVNLLHGQGRYQKINIPTIPTATKFGAASHYCCSSRRASGPVATCQHRFSFTFPNSTP